MGDELKSRNHGPGIVRIGDAVLWQRFLDPSEQQALLTAVRQVAKKAPMHRHETRRGQKMSVQMTSAGTCGWFSDRKGYRYEKSQPSGADWPPIPGLVLRIWEAVSGVTRLPDTCLINFYGEGARMGLHQDRDEVSFDWPVVSVSLGDDALFRIGGIERSVRTRSVWLKSGDVLVMGGPARLAHHGIDRIRFGSSRLLPRGGRINLTLRVAT